MDPGEEAAKATAATIGGGEEKREKGGQVDERERENGLRFWGFDAVC